jgi:ABC-type amino acid transport substrate-binding protein
MTTIEPGVLNVVTYSGFAPVCAAKDGKAWGKDISFVERFAADNRLRTHFHILNEFEGIWRKPGEGSYDMAAAGITATPIRKETSKGVVWSDNYFHVQRSFLIRSGDEGRLVTICDFKGRKIAVTKASTADDDLKVRNPCNAELVYVSDQDAAIEALLGAKFDAFAEGDVSNDYLAGLRPGKLLVIDRHNMFPDGGEPFSFPMREASGILDEMNAWLKTRTEGDYRNG